MNATKAVNQRSNPSSPATSRRSFLGRAGALGTVGAVPLAGLFGVANKALGQNAAGIPASDVAILQFLAAAELLECDRWQQYCELAMNNPGYREALRRIDESLPDYICGDFEDECSHANLINVFLRSIGAQPVNLDIFRTLPSSTARGAQQIGRLTSLANLTVDTISRCRPRRP